MHRQSRSESSTAHSARHGQPRFILAAFLCVVSCGLLASGSLCAAEPDAQGSEKHSFEWLGDGYRSWPKELGVEDGILGSLKLEKYDFTWTYNGISRDDFPTPYVDAEAYGLGPTRPDGNRALFVRFVDQSRMGDSIYIRAYLPDKSGYVGIALGDTFDSDAPSRPGKAIRREGDYYSLEWRQEMKVLEEIKHDFGYISYERLYREIDDPKHALDFGSSASIVGRYYYSGLES